MTDSAETTQTEMPRQTNYLASKPRFDVLDGLRGVAALVIVAFHLLETFSHGNPRAQIINHGYLAVDFFFALSGFVIGYAYDDRWKMPNVAGAPKKWSLWIFFKRRLVRLHPMVVLGTLFGAVFFYFEASPTFANILSTPWWMFLTAVGLGCLMIPTPPSFDIRGWQEMNSLDDPTWSLFWEYLANILYALVIRHFPLKLLAVVVAAAGFFTVALTQNWDLFGLLAERTKAAYTVIGGWSITPTELYVGATRLAFPFFAGLLLSRLGKRICVRHGFWVCAAAVFVLLAMPRVGTESCNWLNGVYEAFVIIALFPLIVAIGARSEIKNPRSAAICKFLGEISYPLYLIHIPLVDLQIAFMSNHPDAPLGTTATLSVGVYLLSIAAAWAALKLFDQPVRAWLRKHCF